MLPVKKQRKKPVYLEDLDQQALIEWAKLAVINGIHVIDHLIAQANGGYRPIKTAATLKKSGVKAGVSDLQLCYPTARYHGLWIEMKRPKTKGRPAGTPTQEQIDWIDSRKALGYAGVFCYSVESAIQIITTYLKGGEVK